MEQEIVDFNPEKKGLPVIKFNYTGLSFSIEAVELLGAPEYIVIAFDAEAKRIYAKPAKLSADPACFKFNRDPEKTKRITLSARNICKDITNATGLRPKRSKGFVFPAFYDHENDMLIAEII